MSDIPEWLKNEVSEFYYGNPVDFMNGVKKCFDVLSKPQNLKHIPEVKELVGALFMYAEELDWDRVNTFATINERGKRAKQALKPFSGD